MSAFIEDPRDPCHKQWHPVGIDPSGLARIHGNDAMPAELASSTCAAITSNKADRTLPPGRRGGALAAWSSNEGFSQ